MPGSFADFTPVEVEHLWWFLDGTIMQPDVRHDLWRSWGLCTRHAWAHAVVECELRYQPLSTAILYRDLLGRAVRRLRAHRPWPLIRRALRAGGLCPTCAFVRSGEPKRRFAEQTAQVNAAARFREYVQEGHPVWNEHGCPACGLSGGPQCRRHLVDGAGKPDQAAADYLADVTARLDSFTDSMTWQGPPQTPERVAALVEALGFIAGWDPALLGTAGTDARGTR
jgi:hypothetical protein